MNGRGPGASVQTLRRLLAALFSRRRAVALAAALATWTTAANVGLLAIAAYLISLSALKPPLSALIPAAVVVQILGGSRGFARYADRIVSHDLTFGLLKDMRVWLYGRLEPLAPGFLSRARSGDLLSRMVGDVEELQNLYLRAVSPVVVATAVCGMTLAVLYAFYPPAALVVLGFFALAGLGAPVLVGALERGAARRRAELRAELDARLVDGLWGVADLLASGREGRAQREVADVGDGLRRQQNRESLAGGLREALHDLLAGLATLSVLVLAIPQVAEAAEATGGGAISGVYLALLALLTLGSFEAVLPLGEAFQSLGGSVAAGERLFEVADEEPEISDPPLPLPAPEGREVGLQRLSFRYAPEEPPVLSDISFRLAAGQKVAVVGPSGSGKSTLASLLMRFHDPSGGRILLDGEDLRGYTAEEARAAFAVAEQEGHLFSGSVRENLLLAGPEAADAELAAALRRAQLSLPDGLEAQVGEGGSRLSGGERRRLVVARALLREAPLMVLDEPTAGLDTATERRLIDAVHEAAQDRSLLLITHRLVGLERMDEILVLDGGRVAERGTHHELLAAGGMYRRMVEVQNRMIAA
ncbi:thiol reductant ABC exporter subunit CydC [Rubrobacter aplysinae]|uniref:thiol reductant ABC exporter subunit CydC n=1 Tax=Rubrobacter aplysinae TaxID=909625 RepID=UPI00064B8854|nr:thiol reductant ABC exporter subunit CydC [Rubrobacter aplysinae]